MPLNASALFLRTRGLSKRADYLERCQRANCKPGTACDVERGGGCKPCRLGTYAPYDLLSECYRCPTGTRGTERVAAAVDEACQSCPAGFYADREAQSECAPCPPGQFQNKTGATACTRVDSLAGADLCNATHFFVEAATSQAMAVAPVRREGRACPSSSAGSGLSRLVRALLGVFGGFVAAAIGYYCCYYCCCCGGRRR